ncbi:MAG: PKD domain-containing protein [Myxococcales bacterium]|nr:PKD domain-containing protein [Myxococcales bacterium]
MTQTSTRPRYIAGWLAAVLVAACTSNDVKPGTAAVAADAAADSGKPGAEVTAAAGSADTRTARVPEIAGEVSAPDIGVDVLLDLTATDAQLAVGEVFAETADTDDADAAAEIAEDALPVVPPCTDKCAPSGSTACSADGVQTCGPSVGGCLALSPATACPVGTTCKDGACFKSCPADGCPVLGARKCGSGAADVLVCTDLDVDGCGAWTPEKSCAKGLVCQSGLCALICSQPCPFIGATQCQGALVQACGDSDGDGCPNWGSSVGCPAGSSCQNNVCQLPCTNTCAVKGLTECVAGGMRLCNDADGDGCLSWSLPSACPLTEACTSTACTAQPPPAKVVINEIAAWPSAVGGAAPDLFVELYGPVNTDLAGWQIISLSAGGTETAIALSGKIAAPGYFTVVHPKASSAVLAKANSQNANVSVPFGAVAWKLKYGKTQADAVAWAASMPGPAGEGSLALLPGPTQSLGRDVSSTDSNDNGKDFQVFANITPGAVNFVKNGAPKASLVCPIYGGTGMPLGFDATGTVDPENQWQSVILTFGDGKQAELSAGLPASHSYNEPGHYDVALKATDNVGQIATASCEVHVEMANAPEVVLVRPSGGIGAKPGAELASVVRATALPGRKLAQVELRVADLTVAASTVTASTFSGGGWKPKFTVPNAIGTTLRVEARATDDLGAVGISQPTLIYIKDELPVARFYGRPLSPSTVLLDARLATDWETPSDQLQFRWDWNSDGIWDTPFSDKNRIIEKGFPAIGKYLVRMEVKDSAGQSATLDRQVWMTDPLAVSGSVATATWGGVVKITGTVVVAAGQTLTITPGTTILADGSDAMLEVQGKVVVTATVDKPVVFAPYGSQIQETPSWTGLYLVGKGTTLTWAIVDGADSPIDSASDAILTDVLVKGGNPGVRASAGGKLVSTRLTVLSAAGDGIEVQVGATLSAAFALVDGATGFGMRNLGGLTVGDSTVSRNFGAGIGYSGLATGSVIRTTMLSNGYEGLRIEQGPSGSPTPALSRNALMDNAKYGSRALATVGIEVATVAADVTTVTSTALPMPKGIVAVQVAYTETDAAKAVAGRLRAGPKGQVLVEWSLPFSGWVLLPTDLTVVAAEVSDGAAAMFGKLQVQRIAYFDQNAIYEVSLLTTAVMDLRYDWLGVFPKVLEMVAVPPGNVNLQGFACKPYDKTWTRVGCVGGEGLAPGTTTWFGSQFVTGDVTVAAGQTLVLAPSTHLYTVPFDALNDGVGDWQFILSGGNLTANGTPASPVIATAMAIGTDKWRGLRVTSATSVLTMTSSQIGSAHIGIAVENGKAVLNAVNVQDSGEDGVAVPGPIAATLTAHDLVASNNARAGLWVGIGSIAVDHCLLEKNGWGARWHGPASGQLDACVIRDNVHEGALIGLTTAVGSPTAVIHGSNLQDNCTGGCGVLLGPAQISKTDAGFKGSKFTTAWTPFGTSPIYYAVATYTESDPATYVLAQIRQMSSTGTIQWTSQIEVTSFAIELFSKLVTTLVGEVADTSTLYAGMLSIDAAFGYGNVKGKQLAAFHNGSALDLTGNWWGTAKASDAVTLNRPEAANLTGAMAGPSKTAGPQGP